MLLIKIARQNKALKNKPTLDMIKPTQLLLTDFVFMNLLDRQLVLTVKKYLC